MNRLRTYLARNITVVLIAAGFSLYMLQPAPAQKSSQAFARWLSTMAKTTGGAELQKELNDLRHSAGHLDQMIKQASRIVSSNNEDFDFSFKESVASQHLYQLLLIEWSQFQTENAMAGIPGPSTVKLLVSATMDKLSTAGLAAVGAQTFATSFTQKSQFISVDQFLSFTLVPMIDGIAIGAP